MGEYIRKTFTFEGKRYTVRGKTEKEAIMKMANKQRDLEEGRVVVSGNMTVEAWALKANTVYRPKQASKTRKSDIAKMRSGIFKYIGNRPLKSIKKIELQEILNKQEGSSADSVYLFDCGSGEADKRRSVHNSYGADGLQRAAPADHCKRTLSLHARA